MTTYGVTSTGFVVKPLSVIQTEIDDLLKSIFGSQINTSDQTVFGQLKGLYSDREASVWEKMADVYDSQYRSSSSGPSLDLVNSLISADRLPAVDSRIFGQALFGVIGTFIPTGALFSVLNSPSVIFSSLADVTLVAGTDEIQTLTFVPSTPTGGTFEITYESETSAAIAWDDGATEIQTALNNLTGLSGVTVTGTYAAGFVVTFAGDDGTQPQADLGITNNGLLSGVTPIVITVTETVTGVYQGSVDCLSQTEGEVVANADTLTVIDSPIIGLTRVFNPEAAATGRVLEEDTDYRIRSENEIQVSRAGTAAAQAAAILDLNDDETKVEILSAKVFENDTNSIDAAGRPPKSTEAIVYQDGNSTTRDQEIAEAIMRSKGGGIETFGDISKTVVDSQGFSKVMKFSRAAEELIYLELDLTVTSLYPSDGDSQVQTLMKTFGDSLGVGQDVIVFPTLVGKLDSIAGITDVVVRIGTAPGPTLDDNIVIDDGAGGNIEISVWDLTRITVSS